MDDKPKAERPFVTADTRRRRPFRLLVEAVKHYGIFTGDESST
jgi:hypothetical protein